MPKQSITKDELKFIKDNFVNEGFFTSYCEDYILLRKEEQKMNQHAGITILPTQDYRRFTSEGQYGMVTGIVLKIDYVKRKNQFYLLILTCGRFQWVVADAITTESILYTQEEFRKNPEGFSEKEIDDFEFLYRMPVVLICKDRIANILSSLNPNLYGEAIPLYEKIKKANK